MIINHNLMANNAIRNMNINSANASKSMQKLSSGLRINGAADDAAGLAISEKMRGQIRGLNQASANAQDGISLVQTAEGALNETTSILQRMRELAVQGSNDTATDDDRKAMQSEVSQLKDEIDRIGNTTQFNTKNLLNGDLSAQSVAKAANLNSINLDTTATQGTSTGTQALGASASAPVNIATGVNDNIKLAVDGGTAVEISIKQGQYTNNSDLAAAINYGIGQSTLAGKVTAQVTTAGTLAFVSTATGSTSGVAVTDGTKSAKLAIGFNNATDTTTSGAADVTLKAGGETLVAGSTNIKLTVGGKSYDNVDLTQYGLAVGDSFGGNGTANDANSIKALQAAFDDKFGKGAVTVTDGGSADKLTITSALGDSTVTAATTGALSTAPATASTTSWDNTSVFDAGTAVAGTASNVTVGASTKLVSLGDGSQNNLGLKAGNQINISVIVGGQQQTSTLAVTGTSTLQDLADAVRNTIGGTAQVTIADGKLNITGQTGKAFEISNLKLNAQVSDTDTTAVTGNFSNKLSAFTETQAAADSHVDTSLSFQIGANQDQTMKVDINDMRTEALQLSSIDVSTQQGAETATSVIDNATKAVSAERAKLGAFQNRLEHTINNLGTSSENLTSAESRIRDVDMASEMSNFSKNNILSQAAQAMLAQANTQPQQVLQLLR